MKTRDLYVYANFKMEFPNMVEDVVDWWDSYDFSIILKLKDGSKMIYNSMTSTIRRLKTKEEIDRMSEEEWKNEFAHHLLRLMNQKRVSQIRMSELSEISRITINKYVTGKTLPNLYHLRKMAKVLKCSISDLMFFENDID